MRGKVKRGAPHEAGHAKTQLKTAVFYTQHETTAILHPRHCVIAKRALRLIFIQM